MKLIIDISEDVYTRLFDNGIQDNEIAIDDICEMARSLRLGTSFQKGHGKIVDINKLIDSKCNECGNIRGVNCTIPCYEVRRMLDVPTIIEADTESGERE